MAFRVWTPVPLAIWLVAGAIGIAGATMAVITGRPAQVIAVAILFVAGIAYSAVRYYAARIEKKRKVRAVSVSGVEVLSWDKAADERWHFGISALAVKAIDETLAWWIERFPERERYLREAWAGHLIVVQSKVIMFNGKPNRGLLTDADDILVAWLPGEDFDRCAKAVRHELGHVARRRVAADASEKADHDWFDANGYKA